MALFIYNEGAISGKVGGRVYSHNRGGAYCRAFKIPTNPQSAFQTAVRNGVSSLTTRWSGTLTIAQRTAWETYAQNVTVTNRVGAQIKLSGLNMYVRSNTPRLQAGMALVDSAPTIFDTGSQLGGSLTFTGATNFGTLTLTTGQTWTGSGAAALLYLSRAQNNAINFFKGPYRLAGTLNGNTAANVIALPFIAGPAGSKLFGRLIVSRSDGRLSPVFPLSGTGV